jgi:quinol monooxygenase YgiN
MSDAVSITTNLRARAGQEQALMEVLRALAESVRREETGCLHYLPTRSRHDPCLFAIFERYRDDQALTDHVNSAHLTQALPALMACVSEPPELRIYEALEKE